jgi:FkbM family methyltransferase
MFKRFILSLLKAPISYAQAGEDRVVNFLFSGMGINTISYIDIGANLPVTFNNTYLFYKNGGNGVLVEPYQPYGRKFRKVRPRDKVVSAAISDQPGEADFYIFSEPAINTLSKAEAEAHAASGNYKLTEVKKTELITIGQVIEREMDGKLPDLISLDVEGVDYAVLSAFDFTKYPVPVWIVETCSYSENHIKPKVTSIIDLMLSKGYFVYADTYINTIFVHKEWFYSK